MIDARAESSATPKPATMLPHCLEQRLPSRLPRWLFDTFSNEFNLMVGGIVMLNAILVGLETDLGESRFTPFEHIFCLFFLLEMLMRMKQSGLWAYWSEVSNVFDTLLVCAGAADLYINPLIMQGGHSGISVSLLRVMRLLRMLRILRILRIFHLVHLMTVILQAFVTAFMSVMSIGTLLLVLNYIVAVLLTQTVGHHAKLWGEHEALITEWFGTIGASMRTLFIIMTLVDWDTIALRIAEVYHPIVVFPCFILYILISSYTMVSLITAIISESLIAAQHDDAQIKERALQESRGKLWSGIEKLLTDIDEDGSGTIDRDEVKAVFDSRPELKTNLHALDVKVDMDDFMNLLDRLQPVGVEEDSDGVAINEVVDALVNLSGTAKASALFDLKHMVIGTQKEVNSIKHDLRDMKDVLGELSSSMRAVVDERKEMRSKQRLGDSTG